MGLSISQRVKKHRDALRASGLRPIQLWVPDTRRKGFAAECKRQSLLILNDSQETEILDWATTVVDQEHWK